MILPIAIYGFHEGNVTGGPDLCALWRMGARWLPDVMLNAQEWRLLVPIFLHANILHLALNVQSQVYVYVCRGVCVCVCVCVCVYVYVCV